MKATQFAQIAFLIVGVFTIAEFLLLRGMFSWLIAVGASALAGSVNLVLCLRQKDWLQAALYLLSTFALCMGYFVFA